MEIVHDDHHWVGALDFTGKGGVDGGESCGGMELMTRELFGVSPCAQEGAAPLMEGARVEMASDCVKEFARREGMGQEVLWMSGGVRTFHAREHAYAERCATRSEPSHVLSDEWFVTGGALLEGKDGFEACFRTGEGKFRVLSVEEAAYAIENLRHGEEVPTQGVLVIYEATRRVAMI